MNLLFWGITISVVGKVLLATGVLLAHTEIAHEGKIDNEVIKSFKIEKIMTVVGLVLIVLGYFMEISFYGFTTNLLTCSNTDCLNDAAAILSQ